MKRIVGFITLMALMIVSLIMSGCGSNDARLREIVREELSKDNAAKTKLFELEKFGFGGALEKEWSHAQGVKSGNMIFISGQQPYDTNLDDKGMPFTDLETGKDFKTQLRTVLENIQKVLVNYDATMDDVVFLQGFVDSKAGENEASFDGAAEVISEFFPNAQQSMTFIMVENLYGPEQLIEANAIAMVSE